MSVATPDESTNEPPSWWRSGLNFAAAITRYVAAGCPQVTKAQYEERVRICAHCPLCRHAKCLICGCFVEEKAKMATEQCPRDPALWPDLNKRTTCDG